VGDACKKLADFTSKVSDLRAKGKANRGAVRAADG